MSEPNAVVVFAKAPVPGRVKTRLAETLGDEPAAQMHRAFLADLARTVSKVKAERYLATSGDDEHDGFDPYRASSFRFVDQGEGNLGARLARVTSRLFERGHKRVVVIGSDSPTLTEEHFKRAFGKLAGTPVVLGPSFDGGYYLVGLSGPNPGIFEGIDWSTRAVAHQTLERCRKLGLLWDLLGFWYDVDTAEDLDVLRFHLLGHLAHMRPNSAPHTVRVMKRYDLIEASP